VVATFGDGNSGDRLGGRDPRGRPAIRPVSTARVARFANTRSVLVRPINSRFAGVPFAILPL
jgi:hypothetical protein